MTGIFLDTRQSKRRVGTEFITETARTPGETFRLSLDKIQSSLQSVSEFNNIEQGYADRIAQMRKMGIDPPPNPYSGWIPEAHAENISNAPRSVQVDWFEDQFEKRTANLSPEQKVLLENQQQMLDRIGSSIREKDRQARIAMDNTSSFGRFAGVMGEFAGFVTDPLVLITLPAGWPSIAGRTTMQSMARVAISESIIAGASEVVIQTFVQRFRKEMGFEEAGFNEGLRNVLFVMGGGFFLGGLLGGASKSLQNFLQTRRGKQMLKDVQAMNSSDDRTLADVLREQPNPSQSDLALADQLEKSGNLNNDNPLWPGGPETKPIVDIDKPVDKITEVDITAKEQRAASQVEHEARAQAADEAAQVGDLPNIPDEPAVPISGRKVTELDDANYQQIDPNTVNIDADRFQFKSVTEEEGVTPRLKDVAEWDEASAGLTIVWEDAAGRQFIADGHQRAALAKRLLKEDPTANIRLLGIVRKESDGFTAEDVMVEAAMKNIREADVVTPQISIDAARVLRIRPQDMKALLKSLPPRSTMVRTVKGLVQISDRSFRHVINQKVSATHAALVARLVPDKENLQDAIMDVLVREQVITKTDIEAEAIIRQAREAGTRTEVQETLFGKEVLETSLFSERAAVLNKALQKLKKEGSVFRNLVKNQGKIQEEGNILKADINQQIATENAVAVQLLMKLANRTGALSNALTEAARLAGETKKFGPAVDQFIESIREAITRGDFEGPAVSGAGRSVQAETQARADTQHRTAIRDAEELADDFKDLKKGDAGIPAEGRLIDEEIAAAEADRAGEKIPENFEDPNTGNTIPSETTIEKIAKETKDDNDFMDGLAGCLRS